MQYVSCVYGSNEIGNRDIGVPMVSSPSSHEQSYLLLLCVSLTSSLQSLASKQDGFQPPSDLETVCHLQPLTPPPITIIFLHNRPHTRKTILGLRKMIPHGFQARLSTNKKKREIGMKKIVEPIADSCPLNSDCTPTISFFSLCVTSLLGCCDASPSCTSM